MNEKSEASVVSEHTQLHLSLGKYVTGFVFSVGLTLLAYALATHHAYSKNLVIGALIGLAVVQFIVQMAFFLHVGSERRPRWKLAVMFLMLMFVLIVILGSIWIMHNLNYRMTPKQMQQYLNSQDSL